jgi:hypothetical protein
VTTLACAVLVAVNVGVAVHAHDVPRFEDGTPDLNGVWQVLNSANYDLLAHPSRAAHDGPARWNQVLRPGTTCCVDTPRTLQDNAETPSFERSRLREGSKGKTCSRCRTAAFREHALFAPAFE